MDMGDVERLKKRFEAMNFELTGIVRGYIKGEVKREELLWAIKSKIPTPVLDELFNSVVEGASGEHLQRLAECDSGERDYSFSKFVQKAHMPDYFFIEGGLRDFFEGKAPLPSGIKAILSPSKPMDLLILDAIDLMEKGASDKSSIALGFADKEVKDPKEYAKAVLDAIDGKRGYRVFTVCSKGSVYSSVRLV